MTHNKKTTTPSCLLTAASVPTEPFSIPRTDSQIIYAKTVKNCFRSSDSWGFPSLFQSFRLLIVRRYRLNGCNILIWIKEYHSWINSFYKQCVGISWSATHRIKHRFDGWSLSRQWSRWPMWVFPKIGVITLKWMVKIINGSKPYFFNGWFGGSFTPLFLEGHPFAKRHKFFTPRAVIDAMRQAFGTNRFVVRGRLPVDWSHSASNSTKKTLGKYTS